MVFLTLHTSREVATKVVFRHYICFLVISRLLSRSFAYVFTLIATSITTTVLHRFVFLPFTISFAFGSSSTRDHRSLPHHALAACPVLGAVRGLPPGPIARLRRLRAMHAASEPVLDLAVELKVSRMRSTHRGVFGLRRACTPQHPQPQRPEVRQALKHRFLKRSSKTRKVQPSTLHLS